MDDLYQGDRLRPESPTRSPRFGGEAQVVTVEVTPPDGYEGDLSVVHVRHGLTRSRQIWQGRDLTFFASGGENEFVLRGPGGELARRPLREGESSVRLGPGDGVQAQEPFPPISGAEWASSSSLYLTWNTSGRDVGSVLVRAEQGGEEAISKEIEGSRGWHLLTGLDSDEVAEVTIEETGREEKRRRAFSPEPEQLEPGPRPVRFAVVQPRPAQSGPPEGLSLSVREDLEREETFIARTDTDSGSASSVFGSRGQVEVLSAGEWASVNKASGAGSVTAEAEGASAVKQISPGGPGQDLSQAPDFALASPVGSGSLEIRWPAPPPGISAVVELAPEEAWGRGDRPVVAFGVEESYHVETGLQPGRYKGSVRHLGRFGGESPRREFEVEVGEGLSGPTGRWKWALPSATGGDAIDLSGYTELFGDWEDASVVAFSSGDAHAQAQGSVVEVSGSGPGVWLARTQLPGKEPLWAGGYVGEDGAPTIGFPERLEGTAETSLANPTSPDVPVEVLRGLEAMGASLSVEAAGQKTRLAPGAGPPFAAWVLESPEGKRLALFGEQRGEPSPQVMPREGRRITGLEKDGQWVVAGSPLGTQDNPGGSSEEEVEEALRSGGRVGGVASGSSAWRLSVLGSPELLRTEPPEVYRGVWVDAPRFSSGTETIESGNGRYRVHLPGGLLGVSSQPPGLAVEDLNVSISSGLVATAQWTLWRESDGELVQDVPAEVEVRREDGTLAAESEGVGSASLDLPTGSEVYEFTVLGESVQEWAPARPPVGQARVTYRASGDVWESEVALAATGSPYRWRITRVEDSEGEEIEAPEPEWQAPGETYSLETQTRPARHITEVQWDADQTARVAVPVSFALPTTSPGWEGDIVVGAALGLPEVAPGMVSFTEEIRAGSAERMSRSNVYPPGTLRISALQCSYPRGTEGLASAVLVGPSGEVLGQETELEVNTEIRVKLKVEASGEGKSPRLEGAYLEHTPSS